MILIYYPLILFSILGYGFFASKKILSINSKNLGYQGIIGIFSLLPINIGCIKFSLTASWTESIGRGKPALTIAALTPFFLCA